MSPTTSGQKGQSQTDSKSGITIRITNDRLSASIFVPQPAEGAPTITLEEIQDALKAKKIVQGLLEDTIKELPLGKLYDKSIVIATGVESQPGDDAKLTFMFDKEPDHSPKTNDFGRIDYREVNFVQGIEKGRLLVRKTPATEGVPGTGVDGEPVSASSGKDVKLPKGTNTEISEDALDLIASTSGAIVYMNGTVSVRDVLSISGDVDFSTGNIRSPGSVKIVGDIKGGFKVHADGDIEVSGGVGDAELISQGNVMIKGGFSGRGDGLIKADGNVTVQHVEGQRIVAGGSIFLGGDALNARLVAGESVIVRSPSGAITGGEVIAEKEIRASTLGSEAWTETVLRVANDAGLKAELERIASDRERLKEDQERVNTALSGLVRQEMAGRIPESKKEAVEKLRELRGAIPENLTALDEEEAEVHAKIKEMEKSIIIASAQLFQGVKACFGIVYLDVKKERGPTELTCVSGRVLADAYKSDKQND